MRFFQSSTGLTLTPGGQGSIVVAYIFAAPVAIRGCPGPARPAARHVKPGDPTLLGDAGAMLRRRQPGRPLTGFISATDIDASGSTSRLGTEVRSGPWCPARCSARR